MIQLPSLFSNSMVLQRGIRIPVWGWAEPGERVTVALGAEQAKTTAGADRRWTLMLGPLSAGGPWELTVSGTNRVTITDVMIGEVWICSGQSNMDVGLNYFANNEQEIAAADYPGIRMFTVAKTITEKPRAFAIAVEPCDNVPGTWAVCTPQTAPSFSAVGYYFARDLHRALGVPVGMLNVAWGGTPVEAWIDQDTAKGNPALAEMLAVRDRAVAEYARHLREAAPAIQAWATKAEAALAAGQPVPVPPQLSVPDPRNQANLVSSLFNGMITPLVPYGLAGVIWYQGESNVNRAKLYRTLFPLLISCWRKAWGPGDFPFYFVQLPNYMAVRPEPGESDWAALREAQRLALALPQTGMAVTIDIGEANDIHPRNKLDVGKRLALWALAQTYGQTLECSGPLYARHMVDDNQVRINFTHAGTGLMAKGGATLQGFAICGADRDYVWADAVIDGETVIVRSDKVPDPVSVRYAWADNPVCNLYNQNGLPASPFCTDEPWGSGLGIGNSIKLPIPRPDPNI